MRDVFYEFEWKVAPAYDWRDWLSDDGRAVVLPTDEVASVESAAGVELLWNRAYKHHKKYGPVLQPAEGAVGIRTYRPMDKEHAALFKTFGALDYRDQSALLAFAGRYGHLGLPPQSQHIQLRAGVGGRAYHAVYGEPYLSWALEICFMREAIRTSGRKRDADDSARLKWLFDRSLQYFQGRLNYGPADEPRLVLRPMTLLSAMWIQLAVALTGDKRFEQCKFCGKVFEISTDPTTGHRSNREFCSGTCKTGDYRRRKTTALKLASGGATLRELAQKTSTDPATIRRWLKKVNGTSKSKPGGK